MKEAVKIVRFDIENVKRVKAVHVTPNPTGLTTIGGNNKQGKSSVLDGIMGALLGDRYKPTAAVRDGAEAGEIKVELSNGMTVERKYTGKNSYLKVIAADGMTGGQGTLNDLLAELALNLGGFMRATPKEKARTLMQALGIDTKPYDDKIEELYQLRTIKGRERDSAKGFFENLPRHDSCGVELVDITDIANSLQSAMDTNSKITEQRQLAQTAEYRAQEAQERTQELQAEVERLEAALAVAKQAVADNKTRTKELFEKAQKLKVEADKLQTVDIMPLKEALAGAEEKNDRIRDNQRKIEAGMQVKSLASEYSQLTGKIESTRQALRKLLDANPLPLEGLTIEGGELLYHGKPWESMSGAERLEVATAVVHLIKPTCGFVLIDGLEQMDLPTLQGFASWLEKRGLQAIGTRVSTGEECSLIIEDGTAHFEAENTKERMNNE